MLNNTSVNILHQRQNSLTDPSLLSLLQGGGLIFYVRHAEATVGEDQPYLNFNDCLTQRNLSNYGRRQALMYGDVLRRNQIPVMYPVHTSPFCRNRETAALVFGEQMSQVDSFLFDIYRLSFPLSVTERDRIVRELQAVLELPPTSGTNKVIIAHSFPQGVGFGPIPDMGTVVIRPRGQGNGFEVVAQLTLNDFIRL
ncbi:histidine phosphatase family protein [Halalkalibacter krulwichiae]|uniref:Histidine phosphatase superfamily (Branch 1) n=1 Tax=Halalkalibacter krulwichiae TaxID=199441 RepID=A0A1X9M8J2_9BACI|nr:histidine phosphatase family protein [Halalkalibacter krulwichiae]ARK29716.1 hypothetical protein BkAM31D_07485 [Halalkalibacter krulwichiae]